jgi:hypothetical protein
VKLPSLKLARIEREKITGYLLNPEHPEGGRKAEFFGRFGFERDNWQAFAAALRHHAGENDVARETRTVHGTSYVVEGELRCPDGRRPRVRAVWIVDLGSETPRLVTAYPLKGGGA